MNDTVNFNPLVEHTLFEIRRLGHFGTAIFVLEYIPRFGMSEPFYKVIDLAKGLLAMTMDQAEALKYALVGIDEKTGDEVNASPDVDTVYAFLTTHIPAGQFSNIGNIGTIGNICSLTGANGNNITTLEDLDGEDDEESDAAEGEITAIHCPHCRKTIAIWAFPLDPDDEDLLD